MKSAPASSRPGERPDEDFAIERPADDTDHGGSADEHAVGRLPLLLYAFIAALLIAAAVSLLAYE